MRVTWATLSTLLLFSVFSSGLPSIGKAHAVTDGLVGYWSLNEGSGFVAHDTSGNGNDGSLVNTPSWVDGVFGKAVHFDGTNDYIEAPHSSILNNANFTVEAWIYLDSDVGNTQTRIISKQQSRERCYSLDIFGKGYYGSEGNQVVLVIGTGSTWVMLTSNSLLLNRTWYHVAGTHEGTMSKIYINGTLDRFGTTAAQTTSNSGTLTIGCSHETGSGVYNFFNGTVDDVRIYNRALSQSEIQMDIIPEFPSFLILPLFIAATLLAVTVYKKREKLSRATCAS